MKTLQILMGIALMVAVQGTNATEVNHCSDPQVVQSWQQKIDNYPSDPLVQKLFALRKGLCAMVDEGTIELAAAVRLFDREQGEAVLERINLEAHENRFQQL
ncbi:MAG: hypothetical protein KUG52_02315 [Immundisolibacteraceae bacterium]|nr:hypothetical protein [Immundisolibacteraceae bacterium]